MEERKSRPTRNDSHLPLGEEIAEEAVDGLLEVQVAVDVEVPHLGRHLDEEIDHAGQRSKHHLHDEQLPLTLCFNHLSNVFGFQISNMCMQMHTFTSHQSNWGN